MAASREYRQLLRIIARFSRSGALLIDAILEELHRDAPTEEEIAAALRAGRGFEVEGYAAGVEGKLLTPMRGEIGGALDLMAAWTAQGVAQDYGRELNAGFLRDRAAAAARTEVARMVTVVTDETRQTIREIIADNAAGARPWQEAALDLRRVIGLNRPQAAAYQKLADQLKARELAGEISAEKRDRMLERERRRLIKQRAKVIASTEAATAANLGQATAWREGVAEGVLPRDIFRRWVLSADPCETCEAIGENQPVALDEPFFSSPDRGGDGGVYMHPPVHPKCACGVRLERPS